MKETVAGRERYAAARKREDDFLARAVQQSDEAASKKQEIEFLATIGLPTSTPAQGDGGSGGITAVLVSITAQVSMSCPDASISSSSS